MDLKGKQLSLGSKVFAGLFVLATYVLSLIYRWNITVSELISVGIFIAALFSPVDVSLIAEKFGSDNSRRHSTPDVYLPE